MFVKPWNKEAENILKQLSLNGKAYTKNSILPRLWSRRYPDLDDFIEVFHNRRKQKTVFLPLNNVVVIPKPKTKQFQIKRLKEKFGKFDNFPL